jgi:hypothetical protein
MTPPVVLLVAGCVLILLGLISGGIDIKYAKISGLNSGVRGFSVVMGICLIALGIWLAIRPASVPAPPQALSYSKVPAAQPQPDPSSEPARRPTEGPTPPPPPGQSLYLARIIFYGLESDPPLFVTRTGAVVEVQLGTGLVRQVGRQAQSYVPQFRWMYETPGILFGVDGNNKLWNGTKLVGHVDPVP